MTLSETQHGSVGYGDADAPPGELAVRCGHVGMKLQPGEVVRTHTGRLCTPFPAVKFTSNRSARASLNAVDRWLLENAAAQAQAMGNDLALDLFNAALREKTIQTADKDSAEHFLFAVSPNRCEHGGRGEVSG